MDAHPVVHWTEGGKRMFRALALGARGAAAEARRHRRRPHDGRRRVRPCLPGHRAPVAGRLPERAANADRAGESGGPSAAQAEAAGGPAQRRRRPPKPSIGTARRSRSARARWACCCCNSMSTTASRCDARPTSGKPARRPMAPVTGPRSSRCARCWGSSARTSGAARASRSRRSVAASIRTTECSRRFAANTSTWSPRHPCRP